MLYFFLNGERFGEREPHVNVHSIYLTYHTTPLFSGMELVQICIINFMEPIPQIWFCGIGPMKLFS